MLRINYLRYNCNNALFFLDCLLNRNFLTGENVFIMSMILRSVLLENSLEWCKSGMHLKRTLAYAVHFCKHSKVPEKSEIFKVLFEISSRGTLSNSGVYKKWRSSLALLLCKSEITLDNLEMLSLMSRQGCVELHRGLLEHLSVVLSMNTNVNYASFFFK